MWFKRICVLALVMFMAAMVSADVTTLSKTYSVENDSAVETLTFVSTATIIPGIHRIVSVSVAPTPASSQASTGAIFDATSVSQVTLANMMGELESVQSQSANKYFAYPKTVSNGLAVLQGPKTIVTIDYTR